MHLGSETVKNDLMQLATHFQVSYSKHSKADLRGSPVRKLVEQQMIFLANTLAVPEGGVPAEAAQKPEGTFSTCHDSINAAQKARGE